MEKLFKGRLAPRSESATAGTMHPHPCPDTHELLQWLQPVASFILPKRSSGTGAQTGCLQVYVCLCLLQLIFGCVADLVLSQKESRLCVWMCSCCHSRHGQDPERESQNVLYFSLSKQVCQTPSREVRALLVQGFIFTFIKAENMPKQ